MLNLGSEIAVAEQEPERQTSAPEVTTAELAECNCPEFCERDHDAD